MRGPSNAGGRLVSMTISDDLAAGRCVTLRRHSLPIKGAGVIERDDVLGLPPSESTASANACFRIPPAPPYKSHRKSTTSGSYFYTVDASVERIANPRTWTSTVQLFLGCRFHCTKERVRIRAVVSTPGRRK